MIDLDTHEGIATIALNDPDRRNALGIAMFDAFQAALDDICKRDDVRVVVLKGRGRVFCAGFDLAAAVDDPSLMATFIERLSQVNRTLRGLPQVVVASVHCAAIAGGCAVLSACDFVIVTRDAKLGYPVHRIGVSPAVTLPTLIPAIGAGHARALTLPGELIDGTEAFRIGLASHLAEDWDGLEMVTRTLCGDLASKPPRALRVTKQWLNELDGSLDEARSDRAMRASSDLTGHEEAAALLRTFWEARKAAR